LKNIFIEKFVAVLFGIVFLLVFVFVGMQVFYKEITDNYLSKLYSKIFDKTEESFILKQSLSIVYPVYSNKFDPFDFDFYGRQIVANVFDPLIVLDRNLRPSAGLSLNYGMIDDYTWNFTLRKNVTFHDGSVLNFEDVEFSFQSALKSTVLSSYLNSFDKIEKISDYEFNIKTKFPDPLFLSKISSVYIVPSGYDPINPMIGSGPYVFDKQLDNEIYLYPNLSYFCSVPAIKEFKIVFEDDVDKRIDLLTSGESDFLAFVPQSAIPLIKQYGFNVLSLPSLEVQFLLFNFKSGLFSDRDLRRAVSSIINQDEIIEKLGVPLVRSNQFAGSGVFGFNAGIEINKMTDDEIFDAVSKLDKSVLKLSFPKSAELLASLIKTKLTDYGFSVKLSVFDDIDYEKNLKSSPGDMFFMAFKNELGDFSEFLELLVKTGAENNYSFFSNKETDQQIVDVENNLDVNQRLNVLRGIMKSLVEDFIFGVPLFEYEVSYAFSDDFSFEPRLDGLIYLNDIKQIK
jgi:peptide/nickel transport system substrate-binding protein